MKQNQTAAIVLAAGKGTRMESDVHKQYMSVLGRPLICYALDAFEESIVDEVVLVTGEGEEAYCREQIVAACGYKKVSHVVTGGNERYHSVFQGLSVLKDCSCVLIHDGARPCVTPQIIKDVTEGAITYGACVAGMPVKDTIKVVNEDEFAEMTPDRSRLWMIQTPQAFRFNLIFDAYQKLLSCEAYQHGITDDAMVVETMTDVKVKLIRGDYSNIKITTPEDIAIAEALLKRTFEA